jgi:hypothetical protein
VQHRGDEAGVEDDGALGGDDAGLGDAGEDRERPPRMPERALAAA